MTAPLVYSYIRFSTPEQAMGDSRRRQVEAAQAWAAERGLKLDDELRDEGVSGFRGANLAADAALGSFVSAVQGGRVPKGSTLIVESLDRLSREQILRAQNLLTTLLLNGIAVVTLADGRQYTQESVNANPMDFLASLLVFMRANEESAMKSRRLRASWQSKRTKAADSKARLTSRGPAWLRAEGDGWEVIEDRAAIIRRIFAETLEGSGQIAIAQRLNAEGLPTWEGGKAWYRTYVRKVLDNPAVVGTLIPCTTERAEDGRRLRRSLPAIDGYYPAVVDQETWRRVRALVGTRSQLAGARGRHAGGPVRSLLAGLARCPLCGGTVTRVCKGPRGGQPRLVCANAKAGAGCTYHAIRQDLVEAALVKQERGVPAIVAHAPPSTKAEGQARRAVAAIERELDTIVQDLEDLEPRAGHRRSPEERAERARLFERQAAATKELEAARTRLAAAGSAVVAHRLSRLEHALSRDLGEDLGEANRALREAVASVTIHYEEEVVTVAWRHGGESVIPYATPFRDERSPQEKRRRRVTQGEPA